MTPQLEFECLLVSYDSALHRILIQILREFAISSDSCVNSAQASKALRKGSHDLLVVDWAGNESHNLLREIWNNPSSRKPTVLAVSQTDNLLPGVHAIIRKPVTIEAARATFQIAYSRMLMDYRLHARFPVMRSLVVRDDANTEIQVIVTDIGDGGVGLSSKEAIHVGSQLSFSLDLPDAKKSIFIQARVIWTRSYGTAGCEFVRIPPVDHNVLRDWLKQKLQVKKPVVFGDGRH